MWSGNLLAQYQFFLAKQRGRAVIMVKVAKILLPIPVTQTYYYALNSQELMKLQQELQQSSGHSQQLASEQSRTPEAALAIATQGSYELELVTTTQSTRQAAKLQVQQQLAAMQAQELELQQEWQVGQVVRVNFAHRCILGCIVELTELVATDPACKQLKSILGLTEYVLSKVMLEFIDWVAKYNVTYTGNVLKMAIPTLGYQNVQPKVVETYILQQSLAAIKLTPKQQQVVDYVQEHPGLTKAELSTQVQVGTGVISKLQQQGVLVVQPLLQRQPRPASMSTMKAQLLELSAAQQQVLQQLQQQTGFTVNLIHGVTGSGKTEVYFHYLQWILEQTAQTNGQVLILLPEIVLTTQLLSRFQQQFGYLPLVWHSNISEAEKRRCYREIYYGTAKVVIGTRSALFLPYHNLRAIIVDEEHETSLKQEDGTVFYHARDMAIVRARLEAIPVLLLSATPSLESLYNVQQQRYHQLNLPARFGSAVLPEVQLIDLRLNKLESHKVIAAPLVQEMSQTLQQQEQVMLYLNRRGYAPMVLCSHCGERLSCPNCSITLTYHRSWQKLICHHCGYLQDLPHTCSNCGAEEAFRACGTGVEKVAEEVQELFPTARIELMTTDNVSNMQVAAALIERILRREIDIIIGTQMIAKGHHFPDLALVGVIEADGSLFGGDFRALEKTYQILQQVSGRAGRGETKGKVLIQTYNPENPALQALVSNQAERFLQLELENRKLFALPPYGRLLAVVVSAETEQEIRQTMQQLHQYFTTKFAHVIPTALEVFAPVPAPIYRLQKRFRYRMLIHCKQSRGIQIIQNFKPQLLLLCQQLQAKGKARLRIKIDVDPYSFV